jgi:diguanylate cyclase (GGDEF)-like protein
LAKADGGGVTAARRLAVTDSLTGFANREGLLQNFASLTDDNTAPFATIMIDLDGFKQINDTHGHDAGDSVLRVIGTRLQENIRQTDTAVRLGGDEFVVILSNTNGHGAANVAKKIIKSFKEPFNVDGKVLSIESNF